MEKDKSSNGASVSKKRWGILLGVPLLLFICSIALITIGTFNYMKYAFFISRIFIGSEVPVNSQVESFHKVEKKEEEPKEKKRVFPKFGEEFGELVIESADIEYPVFNGDSEELLLKGIGHYYGSRYPGEGSNVVLSGHRNSLFQNLGDIEIGDPVIFKATYAGEIYEYEYKVSDIEIIKRKDEHYLYPTDEERLTMYTCYPFNYIGHAPKRYVVICDFVSGKPLEEIVAEKEGKGDEKTN